MSIWCACITISLVSYNFVVVSVKVYYCFMTSIFSTIISTKCCIAFIRKCDTLTPSKQITIAPNVKSYFTILTISTCCTNLMNIYIIVYSVYVTTECSIVAIYFTPCAGKTCKVFSAFL